ncbi:MAG: 50S ribosomal protein L22 [Anaerolineales bacterium]|nr:50S ribosomal protein L22 [Anaerolineales bacterium]MCL4258653.1 50S ribosomal protein L22 [Anaerolineales bacterium]
MADFQATLSNTSVSAQKMRLVVDLVRGKSAQQAVNILTFTPSKAAQPLLKLVKSAVANAAKNQGVAIEDLYVHAISADEAPTRKWRRFGARGRFKPVFRRTSHVTVTLRQRDAAPAAQTTAPAARKTAAKAEK